VTATTVPCKLQQWDRYRVPQNVFLLINQSIDQSNLINLYIADVTCGFYYRAMLRRALLCHSMSPVRSVCVSVLSL